MWVVVLATLAVVAMGMSVEEGVDSYFYGRGFEAGVGSCIDGSRDWGRGKEVRGRKSLGTDEIIGLPPTVPVIITGD